MNYLLEVNTLDGDTITGYIKTEENDIPHVLLINYIMEGKFLILSDDNIDEMYWTIKTANIDNIAFLACEGLNES